MRKAGATQAEKSATQEAELKKRLELTRRLKRRRWRSLQKSRKSWTRTWLLYRRSRPFQR
jgi:hypothetical protein